MSRSGRRSEDWWEDDAPSEPEGWWGAGGDIHERINQFTSPPSNPPTGLNLIVEAARNPGVHTPFDPTFSNPSPLQPLGPGVPYRHTPGTPYPSFDRPVTSQPIVPATPPTPSIPLLPAPGQTSWVDQSIAPHLPGITNFDFSTGRWRDSQGRFVSAAQAPGMNIAQSHTAQSSAVTPYTPVPYWTQMNPPQPFQPVEPTRTQGLPIIPNVPAGTFNPVQPPAFFPQPGVFSRGEDTYQFRGYGGTQFINNALNQGGAFVATASVDIHGNITSAIDNARAAVTGQVLDDRTGSPLSPIRALQKQGAPYMSWGSMSPQNLAKNTSMIALPFDKDELHWNKIQPLLETLRQQSGYENYVYRGGSHLFDAGALARASFPVDNQGNVYGFTTTKVGQTAGVHETLPFGPAPGQSQREFTSPLSINGNQLQGNLIRRAYFLDPYLLFPEGQAYARSDMGIVERSFRKVVNVPEGGFQFDVGDVFGFGQEPRTFAEGDNYRGSNFDGIPGIPGSGGNAAGARVGAIEYLNNGTQAMIDYTKFLNVGGQSNSKQNEKFYNAPIAPSWFNRIEGVDMSDVQIASPLPGPKYFPSWAANLYQANTPAEQIQKQFPQGITPENLTPEQAQFFTNWGEQFVRENMQPVMVRDVPMNQQVYDMYKDQMMGDQPKVEIVGQGPEGTLLTNIRTMAMTADIIARFRPSESSPRYLISTEEMNQMRQFNQGFYNFYTELEARGALPNAARETISATRANLSSEWRAQQSIVAAEQLDIAGARERARQVVGGEGVTDALRVEMVRQLAKISGNQMVSVGDTVLTSPRTAARHITFDEDGNPINNYAMRYADALLAAEEYQQTARINRPENMGGVDELRAQAARAAFESMQELAGRAETQRQALGVEIKALAGAATGIPGLVENEMVVNKRDLFERTNARTESERRQILQAVQEGKIPGMVHMWPKTNPAEDYVTSRVVLTEQVRRRKGMQDVVVPEGNVGVSSILVSQKEKDEDDDPLKADIGARFVNGELVIADSPITPAEDVRKMADSNYRLELQSMREKAAVNASLDSYFGAVRDPKITGGRSMQSIRDEYDAGAEAKARMGPIYNWSVRDQFNFGMTLLGRSNLSSEARTRATEAMSVLAKAPYQPALDLKDVPMSKLEEMFRFLSFDSSKMPGNRRPWFGGPNAREMDASKADLMGISKEIIRAHAEFGREDENWREMILPSQARAMLPAEFAGDEERYGQMMTALGRDAGDLDVNEIVSAMGREDAVHAVFGSQHDPRLETLSPWMSSTVGAITQRASTRGGKDKFAKPELMQGLSGAAMQIMQGVRSAKSIFQLKRGKTPGIEPLLATGEQLPGEAFEYTKHAMQQMGSEYPIDSAPQQTLPEVQAHAGDYEQFVPPTESATPNYMKGRIRAAEEVLARRERFARTAQDPELRAQHEQRAQLHRQRIASYRVQNAPGGGGLEGIFGGGGGGGPVDSAGVAMPDDMPERPTGGGTTIGTQFVTHSDFKLAPRHLNVDDPAKLRTLFDRFKEFGDRIEEVTKKTGEYTKAQEDLVKWTKTAGNTFEKIVKDASYNRDLIGKGYNLTAEDQAVIDMMETPGFHGMRERISRMTREAGAQLEAREFAEVFREGARTPQPSRDELWDVLGRRGRGAAKQRQEWIDAKFFEQGGIPTEGISGAIVGAAARTRSLFTDESGQAISGLLWRSSMVAGIGLIPQLRAGMDYQNALAERGMNLFTGGMAGYDDLMSGSYGRIMRGAAGRGASQLAFGQQVYNAYGSFYETSFPGIMQGPVGAAAGVLGPAAAIGTIASMSPLGPAGWAIGAGVAAIGAVGYATSASQDRHAQGRYMDLLRSQGPIGAAFGDFSGFTGSAVNAFGDFIAGTPGGESSVYRTDQFYQTAERYSRGEISLGRVREAAKQYGIPDAEALGIVQQQYETSGLEAGVPVEQSRANLAMYWRYAGNQGLPRDYTQAMREFSAAQVNPEAVAQAWAGAMGVNPASPDGRGPALFGTLNWRIHNPDQPLEMLDQRTAMIAQYYGRANQSARIAGLPQTDPFSIVGTPLENNPDRMMFEGDVKDWFNQSMTSNPTFGQQVGFSVMSRAMSMIGQGNLSGATQLLQSRGTYEGIFNQLTASGNSATMSGAAALAYSDLNVDQRRLADSLLSGDRLAISRFGARTGNQRLQILDPETGLPAFEEGINASEAAMLRADDPYNLLGQVSDEQLAGGTRGMENQLRLQGRAQRYYNRGIDLWQRQVSSGFQQGNFFEAAQVFRRFGMQLNVGTGQGYWDIEDAQRGINRQQEAYNLEQGGRNINLQEAQFELAGRQFNEQWNFNRRQFNFQTTYQWNQMQRGFARQEVEWGWQREDMAFDRNKDELQYGWQMEDFDRNIRFARGRERLDLLRQRNRAVITQSMDMMQRQRTEDRFESTVDFQKEGNRLQEQYFKENKKFQEEAQDMNKRHFEERRALERQRMDMTKENHEKQKSWMTERWALEDQRVLLDRQNIELQRKITEEVAQKTAEWQDNTIALQEAMQGIGTYFSDWSVELSNIAANAPKILEILQGIKNLGSLASGNITIQVGSQSINLSQALNNAYTIPQGPG